MHTRYYIGIAVPDELATQITAVQQQLFDPTVAIMPLQPHITILPPPAVEPIPAEILIPKIRRAATTFVPLTITLTHVGTFQHRAVYLEATGPSLHPLQQALTALLPEPSRVRYIPRKDFHPHVTLNQAIRGHTLPGNLVAAYQDQLHHLLPATFTVSRLTLYQMDGPRSYSAEPI